MVILQEIKKIKMVFNLAKCDLCGECLEKCLYMNLSLDESKDEMKKLIDGEFTTVLDECITCVACNQFCEKGANPFDLINRRQEETGAFTTDESVAFMNLGKQAPTEIVEGKSGRPVMSLCVVGDLIPNLFEGKLFEEMTFLKGADYYCLVGYIHAGIESPLRNGLKKVIDNLAKTGFDEIIFFHDDCYAAFTTKAMEYGINVPFKPIHIIEYLRDFMLANKDQIKKLKVKIAYQQPCASRYTPWKDAALNELFELIGAERVHRKYQGINSLCCGIPLSFADKYKERQRELKEKNIKDALNAGAEYMVFLCPLCAWSLKERSNEMGLKPIMLTELCRLAIGEQILR